jgi:hypothetical protein
MSKKKRSQPKQSRRNGQVKAFQHARLTANALDPDEIGIILDPENPARVHSYIFADGTQLKLDNQSVPSKVPSLEPSLIVTSMDNRGPRNTLAYHFGEMMTSAQSLFGPRNTSFLFLGFEFIPYHARVRYVTEYSAVIQLSFRAMMNPIEAYFELAHECVHLLSPNPYKPVTILEEGMASVFSLIYMRDIMRVPVHPVSQTYYDEAAALVSSLLEIDPYGIRKIREEEPDTRKIGKALIMKYYPTVPESVATRLARTFLNGEKDHPDVVAQYIHEKV